MERRGASFNRAIYSEFADSPFHGGGGGTNLTKYRGYFKGGGGAHYLAIAISGQVLLSLGGKVTFLTHRPSRSRIFPSPQSDWPPAQPSRLANNTNREVVILLHMFKPVSRAHNSSVGTALGLPSRIFYWIYLHWRSSLWKCWFFTNNLSIFISLTVNWCFSSRSVNFL